MEPDKPHSDMWTTIPFYRFVMNQIRLAPALVITLLFLATCTQATPTPTPARLPDAQPLPHWQVMEAPGWHSQAGFSLRLPPGWELHEGQGVDSYVGTVIGGDVRLHFDYGCCSTTLNPGEDPEHDYILFYEEIGGWEAKLVRPRDGSKGLTGVHFRRFQGPSLTIVGSDLTPEQQETAFAIFRSIRGLGGLLRVKVTFDPQGLVLEPGIPAPMT